MSWDLRFRRGGGVAGRGVPTVGMPAGSRGRYGPVVLEGVMGPHHAVDVDLDPAGEEKVLAAMCFASSSLDEAELLDARRETELGSGARETDDRGVRRPSGTDTSCP